jgi:hypothetical protein
MYLGKPSHADCLLKICFVLCFSITNNQQFGSVNQKITFYPSSLVISHSARPLTFYDDTKLLHISTQLATLPMGKPMSFSNHSCSKMKTDFFNKLLDSMSQVQQATQRLLALPGFFYVN